MRAIIVALTLGAGMAHAQPQSAQAAFEAGEAALHAGRIEEAATIFVSLEARLSASGKNTRSLGIARTLLAEVELRRGGTARAAEVASEALPALAAPADALMRFQATVTLARAEEAQNNLAFAARHYREALTLLPPDSGTIRLELSIGAWRAALFDNPAAAAAGLEALLPDAQLLGPNEHEQMTRRLNTLIARAYLNAGNLPAARRAIHVALQSTGGRGQTLNMTEVEVHADAAMIAARLRDIEGWRRHKTSPTEPWRTAGRDIA